MKTVLAIVALSFSASAANLTQEPASFAVARSDLRNQYAVLSWKLPADVTNTVIYRAYGEGGPWTEIAETNDLATTYTDETAPLGVPCWYKIAFAARDEENVRTVGDMCAAVVSHRRCQLLERAWDDMTHVKDGVTVIRNAEGKISNNGNGITQTDRDVSAAEAFDNNLKTHPNIAIGSATGRLAVGVDLGSTHHLAYTRCYRRSGKVTSQYYLDVNGIVFYGSNNDSAWFATTEPAVTESVAATETLEWYETAATNPAPFRYFYAYNPTKPAWGLCVTELQFYGYPSTAYDGYAIGAVDLVAEWNGGATVALSWKDNGYGTSFNVERSTDGGTTWTAIVSGLSATSYTDADVALDGTEYLYRIASVSGTATSYSKTVRVVPYVRGDGVGLHRLALFPFISTEATDMTEYVSTGAVSIADAALADARPMIDGVEGSHTNVYVTWTGKLIVPFAGSYKFTAAAKGMVSVWIDDSNVTRYSAASGYTELTSGATTLTAGEHNIRVAYWQGAADSGCTLYWDGAVVKEEIPLSQLKPVVPNALPEPWEGGRQFMSAVDECCPGDFRVNDDGTFDLAFAGADNRTATCANEFMWRTYEGDFVMTTKIYYLPSSKIAGEKAGLMVRAGLAMSDPFESFLFRSNEYDIGLRSRRSVGGDVSEPKTVEALGSKSCWGLNVGSKTIYMKLKREGAKFTYSYRTTKTDQWTVAYEYTDTNGLYGDKVYVGPVAANVTLGNWDTSTYRHSRYAWRFSEIDIHSPRGMCIFFK